MAEWGQMDLGFGSWLGHLARLILTPPSPVFPISPEEIMPPLQGPECESQQRPV